MLTQSRLKEVVYYNHYVGAFIWRDKSRPRTYGKMAGSTVGHKGYVKMVVDGKEYPAHRLVWLYLMGEFPDGQIDHIDGDRANNLASNLRVATAAQNSMNMKKSALNTSGIKGVTFCKQRGKWEAAITESGRRIYREWFDSIDDAGVALTAARARIHGDFANDGDHKYAIEEMLA